MVSSRSGGFSPRSPSPPPHPVCMLGGLCRAVSPWLRPAPGYLQKCVCVCGCACGCVCMHARGRGVTAQVVQGVCVPCRRSPRKRTDWLSSCPTEGPARPLTEATTCLDIIHSYTHTHKRMDNTYRSTHSMTQTNLVLTNKTITFNTTYTKLTHTHTYTHANSQL